MVNSRLPPPNIPRRVMKRRQLDTSNIPQGSIEQLAAAFGSPTIDSELEIVNIAGT